MDPHDFTAAPDEALARLAEALAGAGPAALIAPDPARIVFANAAARARFSAADDTALAMRLLAPGAPAGRRLRDLSAAPPPEGMARLERLRFFAGGQADTALLAARRVDVAGTSLLLLAAPDLDVEAARAAFRSPAPAARAPGAESGASRGTAPDLPAPDAPASDRPASDQPLSARETAPSFVAPPEPTTPARFIWASDAEGRFVNVGPALEYHVGAPGRLVGRSVAEVAALLDAEGRAALLAGFAAPAAWSTPRLAFPIEASAERAVIDLSGAPSFDRARRVVGYRGFGLVRPGRLPAPREPGGEERRVDERPLEKGVAGAPAVAARAVGVSVAGTRAPDDAAPAREPLAAEGFAAPEPRAAPVPSDARKSPDAHASPIAGEEQPLLSEEAAATPFVAARPDEDARAGALTSAAAAAAPSIAAVAEADTPPIAASANGVEDRADDARVVEEPAIEERAVADHAVDESDGDQSGVVEIDADAAAVEATPIAEDDGGFAGETVADPTPARAATGDARRASVIGGTAAPGQTDARGETRARHDAQAQDEAGAQDEAAVDDEAAIGVGMSGDDGSAPAALFDQWDGAGPPLPPEARLDGAAPRAGREPDRPSLQPSTQDSATQDSATQDSATQDDAAQDDAAQDDAAEDDAAAHEDAPTSHRPASGRDVRDLAAGDRARNSATGDDAPGEAPGGAFEDADSPPSPSLSVSPARAAGEAANVVPLRPNQPALLPVARLLAAPDATTPPPAGPRPAEPPRPGASVELSAAERHAFREIARSLGARPVEERGGPTPPAGADATGDETPGDETPPAREHLSGEQPSREPAPRDAPPRRGRDLLSVATRAGAEAPVSPRLPEPPRAAPDAPRGATPAAGALTTQRDLIAAELARNGSTMLDRLPVGVVVTRGESALYANRTLLDLVGYGSLDEFRRAGGVGRIFRGREPGRLAEAADGGAIPLVAADGEVLPVDARVQKLDWEGEPATLITLRRSLDAETGGKMKALELELRARQIESRELHAILDTATDGVAVLDEEGRILALNRSAEALFGYEQNEIAGEHFSILFSAQSQRAAIDYLDGLKSNGVASLLNDGREAIGRERQGGAIPLFMTIGRVGAGEPRKFCAVLRDMSHWKKAERQLEQARRDAERASALKSDFLAKISHEIRTPLNAILGFAEVIMEERFGPVGNARYKDYLKDIHASGAHVMSLVNDLLDLSKIESGKLDLVFGAVDANRIVNECVSLMQPQAMGERVILRVALAPRLPQIVADERSLKQIVLNLLSNAVKFNEPGGQVIVSTALTDAGHAVIRIRDTGIGMSEDEIEVALEPFRQIATARPRGGTGLGLPLTKALVEANRANFTIKSRKREGTLVEIAFPPTRVLAE